MDGGLARVFASVLAPMYLDATLHRRSDADDGFGTIGIAWSDECIRAQLDSATHAMRMTPGFTDTDVAIYVLAADLCDPIDSDCEITVRDQRYAVASVTTDPALSYYLCRGQRA
ncbi:hypothetical protein D3Y57_19200 [Sphingomonas paeninsulae]|uniref:Uncharacterized protein n=2 Tax=Sphingomonas paeninsulae TaxID=2319844 RepID=A0A494TJV1_SPHPE|nr:hypothetical protein D3Y57_19200 [Sphingomonas paeninsulae]